MFILSAGNAVITYRSRCVKRVVSWKLILIRKKKVSFKPRASTAAGFSEPAPERLAEMVKFFGLGAEDRQVGGADKHITLWMICLWMNATNSLFGLLFSYLI